MASDFCLYPDFIEDVVEELLASDIISKDKVAKLKNESNNSVDPNLTMDIRHKEVKKESLVDIDCDNIKIPLKRIVEENPFKTLPKVKDLKTIDKEIAKTRRNLQIYQNQLQKKSESLTNSIQSLEKERENNTSSPVILNFNEDETNHYFNLHLDSLEDAVVTDLPKEKRKTWKPFEIKPHPVINVTTTLKVVDFNQSTTKFDDEELKLLELCELKPIHVTGKHLLSSAESKKEMTNVVPNNSPMLDTADSSGCEVTDLKSLNESKIVKKVIKKWKLYVSTKITKRIEDQKGKKLKNNYLLKQVLTTWIVYVKYSKAKQKAKHESRNKTEICPVKNIKSCIEPSRGIHRKSLELHSTTVEPCFASHAISICSKNQKTESISSTKNNQTNNDNKIETIAANSKTLNKLGDSKIHIKIVTPEIAGLTCNAGVGNTSCNKTHSPLTNTNKPVTNVVSKIKGQEPFANRYAAQEKIISQQSALIEKQKQMILDLQAKNLETRSKLSLKTAESQLAQAPVTLHKKPVHNSLVEVFAANKEEVRKQNTSDGSRTNLENRSDVLTKSMLERQMYCKELAEMTKTRKIRMEREKAKLKEEQEEKERQVKEEQKLLRIQKIKMEHQLAQENARSALALRKETSELTEKAKHHYNYILLKRAFKAFQRFSSDINLQADECDDIYKRKILKRMFCIWKSAAKQSTETKIRIADKLYCTKLVERSWNSWRRLHHEYRIKVQVSEDMFALKLQERMLRRWLKFTAQQYLQTCCKTELAERLYRKQLLKHSLSRWKELPRLMLVEREKEQRRRAWRQAVQELIPDFSPVFAEKLEV